CARYEAESRWEELAQILARRLAKSEAPAEQASLCAALGRVMLESQGDAARAVELLERAVHLDEQRADAWTQLARALDAAGQPQRGLAAADQAIKLGTGEASAQLIAANVLSRLGDDEGALSRLRRVVEIEPRHGFAWMRLGGLAERRGAIDEAARAYARVT